MGSDAPDLRRRLDPHEFFLCYGEAARGQDAVKPLA
jgi:hypothetical protein